MGALVQSWPQRIALALVALAVLWNGLRPLSDLDLWWHITLGEQIVSTSSLVPTDPFSYTQQGTAWPWKDVGAALIFAGLWNLGGANAIVLFKAALGLAIAAILYIWLARLRRVPPTLALLVTAVAMEASSFRLNERAATVSLLLLAIVLVLIERHRAGKGRLWWAVAITVLGANIHRGVLVIPVVLGALAALELLQWRLSKGKPPWTSVGVAVASAAGCLVTPFGTAIFTTTGKLMGGHTKFITEWAPVTWDLVWALTPATLAMAGLVIAGALRSATTKPRPYWDLVLALLAFGIGLGSMRHLPYLALLGAGVAGSGLGRFEEAWTGRLRHVIAVSTGALALVLQIARPLPGPTLGLAPAHYPELGVAFIKRQSLQGRGFNEFGYGGFLIHHLWPEHQVYIDGRTDLVYPPEAVERYLSALNHPDHFAKEAAKWDWQWVVLDNAPPARPTYFLDRHPDWTLVHASRRALVYVRTGGANAHVAKAHGYTVLHPHDLERSVLNAIARGEGQIAHAELRRMIADDPDNLYAVAAFASVMEKLDNR